MKTVLVVLVLGLAAATALATPFEDFQAEFGKTYATPQEAAFRATVFNANLKRVSAMNAELIAAGKPTVYNVTMFMDLTNTEFRARYLGAKQPSAEVAPSFVAPVPTGPAVQKVDWRDKGVITAVKNQGQCGSCWAFSATETIESFWKLGGHSLTDLSPQQIVSCDVNGGDMGCQGGWTYGAYKYVENAGGLESAASYPYTSGGGNDGQCMFKSRDIVARITGWSWAAQNGDESALEQHVTHTGPISICVDASSWQFYTGGVLTQCGQQIDHCVQAVGFDKTGSTPYWIVRNSWTAQWGINGYIHLEMGQNMCALADVATYVSV